MEPVAMTGNRDFVLSRDPTVEWGPARPGLSLRYPSRWFDTSSFSLITANRKQRIKLAPAFDALWLVAERPGRLQTLLKRVWSLSDEHAGIPADALAGFARAMVAARVLVSRPAMEPFLMDTPHEAHVYTWGTKRLVIDPTTCSLWELAPDAAACLRELASVDTPSGQGTAQPELSQAAIELGACRAAGFFRPPPGSSQHHPRQAQALPRKQDYVWKDVALTLDLSDACNLNCRYCYVGRKRKSGVMPESVVRDAVDFFFQTFRANTYDIAFARNGEPLVQLALIRKAEAYALGRARELGLNVEFSSTSSNGAAMTPRRLQQWRECFPTSTISLSVDGPPHVHDAVRTDWRGRGSYGRVARAVPLLKAQGCLQRVAATVTPTYPQVTDIYKHLYSLGAESVSAKPVRVPPGHPLALTEDNVGAVCEGYTQLAEWLLEHDDRELTWLLKSLSRLDYFKRFVLRLVNQQGIQRRCPAGKANWLYVDPRGDIYGCQSLMGMGHEAGRLGSIYSGVDPERARVFQEDLLVTNIPGCRDCWARHLCGGGCYHQALMTNGCLEKPDPAECRLNRHLIELAGWLLARLADRGARLVSAAGYMPRCHKQPQHLRVPAETGY